MAGEWCASKDSPRIPDWSRKPPEAEWANGPGSGPGCRGLETGGAGEKAPDLGGTAQSFFEDSGGFFDGTAILSSAWNGALAFYKLRR
jgi:hypothetical protein